MKILFPTDFSEVSLNALQYTIAFAKKIQAQIDLMHVFHLSIDQAGAMAPKNISDHIDESREALKDKLLKLKEEAPEGVIQETRVDYGVFIYQEVVDAAQSGHYDMIAMGTKGQHNMMEKVLGSVTSNTMLQAKCPVLAVPENCIFEGVNRIAYANDFHPNHSKAVQQLVDFAKALTAHIHFVHVNTGQMTKQIEDFSLSAGAPFKDFSIVDQTNVVDGLQQFIEEKDMDLLALFIPKRTLWERLFHFSVSKNLSLDSSVPILVFHE